MGSKARDLADLPQGDGDLTVDGNVGIGTATPASPLHILSLTGGAQDLLTISSGYNNPSGQQAIAWKDPAGNTIGRIGVEYSAASGGALTFGSLYSGGSNTTERVRILSSGGITFNGDTAAANALDDYEEGTWTPVLVGALGTPSYTLVGATGYYVKIGNLVHATMNWHGDNISGGAGDYYFAGLPFVMDMTKPGSTGAARLYQVNGYNPAVAIYGDSALGVFVSSGPTNSIWRWGIAGDITGTSVVTASISYKTP